MTHGTKEQQTSAEPPLGRLELALIRSCLALDIPGVLRHGRALCEALDGLGEHKTAARFRKVLSGQRESEIKPIGGYNAGPNPDDY